MTDAKSLDGRHAVVTGGGRGIGAAIASELARLGTAVTIMGRDRKTLDAHVRTVGSDVKGARVQAVECDVTREALVQSAFAEAARHFGPVYALVNNAGHGEPSLLHETELDMWNATLAVNLTGSFLCTKHALPAMLDAKNGRVINIASTSALKGYKRMSAYCAAKAGVLGLTRAAAVEVARTGVTVNAICPGYTEGTDLTRDAIENLVDSGRSEADASAMLAKANPGGRLVAPREVAAVVAWLCSPGAAAVNGQAIVAAGGDVG